MQCSNVCVVIYDDVNWDVFYYNIYTIKILTNNTDMTISNIWNPISLKNVNNTQDPCFQQQYVCQQF